MAILIAAPPIEKRTETLVSSTIVRNVAFAHHFGYLFAGHPFRWNIQKKKIESGGRVRHAVWRFNMATAFAYTFFVYFRCIQINLDDSRTNSEQIYMRVMAAYMTLSIVCHLVVIMNVDVLPNYTNQVMEFAVALTDKYTRKDAKTPLLTKGMGLFLQSTFNNINSMTVLMGIGAFLNPTSPEHITSLFRGDPTLTTRILAACSMGYIEYIYHSSALVVTIVPYTAMSIIMSIINELSSVSNKITSNALRDDMTKLKMYRNLQIQMLLFNDIYNQVLYPGTKAVGVVLVVYCTYGGIRMTGVQSYAMAFLGIFMFTLLLLIFSFMAEFHSRSSKLLKEWNRQTRWNVNYMWVSRYLKSMQSLKAVLRSSYYVDRAMVLTLADVLTNNTVNFLLVNS